VFCNFLSVKFYVLLKQKPFMNVLYSGGKMGGNEGQKTMIYFCMAKGVSSYFHFFDLVNSRNMLSKDLLKLAKTKLARNYEKLLIHCKRYILGFVIIIIYPRRGINIGHRKNHAFPTRKLPVKVRRYSAWQDGRLRVQRIHLRNALYKAFIG